MLTLTVRGTISPTDPTDPTIQRHYFIAIDNQNNPNIGPWAAIYPPYGGNGWVTSSDAQNSVGLTSYVQYDSNNPNCYVYNILPGSYFLNTTAPQLPISSQIINGGSTLQVTIDFSQIATAAIPVAQIKQTQRQFYPHQLPSRRQSNRDGANLGRSRPQRPELCECRHHQQSHLHRR